MQDLEQYIIERTEKLTEIAKTYPYSMPVKVAAEFMGLSVDSLRASITGGQCPFAVGYKSSALGNRGFCVETLPFVLHQLQRIGMLKEEVGLRK